MKITVTSAGTPAITLDRAQNGWIYTWQGAGGNEIMVYPDSNSAPLPPVFMTDDGQWELILRKRTEEKGWPL